MFRTAAEIIDRIKRATQGVARQPFDLTTAQRESLRELRTHEGFATFVGLLDECVKFDADQLLSPSAPDATLHFLRGKIAGLRRAGTLVDEILAATDASIQRSTAAAEPSYNRSRAVAVNSPFYAASRTK